MIPANSSVVLDVGTCYSANVVNAGSGTLGIGSDVMSRAEITGLPASYVGNGDGPYVPPGGQRNIWPNGPIVAYNPSATAGSVSLTTWSQ